MQFDDYKARISINGFSSAQAASILADMRTAYDGSSIARSMFDDWFATAEHTITVDFLKSKYSAFSGTGELSIDPDYLNGLSYISDHGKAVLHTQLDAILHELGHALTERKDNYNLSADYFTGDNVKFVNTIWEQLGLPLQVSYVGQADSPLHVSNYEYTNGIAIDGAVTSIENLIQTGKTNDLLISGSIGAILQSGAGSDFLVGGGGDDGLFGGKNKDTAVYFGNPVDYDIRQNEDSSWVVRHVRGAKDEGADTLYNIEQVQFGKDVYALKKNGLTFQTDFAFVVDTTGSMVTEIADVQAEATALVEALFADGKTDARIGVVGFNDTQFGGPTKVVLPFTDSDDFDVRKSAALAAIKSLGASAGGADVVENSFDGLLKALDGSMGEWRAGAGVRRIALFTDAGPKDQDLAPLVQSYAEKIGAVVMGSSMASGAGGSLATFQFASAGGGSDAEGLTLPDDGDPLPDFTFIDEPVDPDTTLATVEIYTIFTGRTAIDTHDYEAISGSTGGSFLMATSAADRVAALLDIIGGLDLVGTPEADALTGGVHIDKLTGLEGDDILDGGANADSMNGGPGDDTYYVDNPKDGVTELPGEGSDGVRTSLTFYTVPDNVENGVFSGDASAILVGNDLANELAGGKGGNSLIGLAGNDVLLGGDGDDLLFGGRPAPGQGPGQLVLEVGAGNDSIASAIDLSNLFSLAADPDILDATTVPHVSVEGKGYGTLHYFAVTLGIGDVLTLDLDRGIGTNSFISVVAADLSVLASADDAPIDLGAGGSTSTFDPFLQYSAAFAGVHYIVVGRVTMAGVPNTVRETGDSYELQVSAAAAAPAGAFASGDDRLAGGLGADLLLGGDGLDSFEGTLAELDGDRIGDYEVGEKIAVQGVAYTDVTVSWGTGSKVVEIDVTGDGIAEASVTLDVAPDDLILAGLHLVVRPAGDGTDASIAFAGPEASIAVLSAGVAEGDSGTTPFTFEVTLSEALAAEETVSWAVAGRGGTPADAADFAGGVLPSGIVTFATGETSMSITVDILGDTAAEADEGFSVFLTDTSPGLALGAAIATGTILDDDGPVGAHGDAYVVHQGQTLTPPLAAGLLANDESASTASLISGPAHGTLQLVGSGNFTYTPAQGFFGIDTFTYQAGNSGPTLDEAQVTIHVVPVQVGASTTLDLLALTAEEQIAATYAAFFSRGADALGFAFWVGEFVQGLPTQGPALLFANIASSFGISDEAKGLYPFLANPFGASDAEITAFLESVYDNLFDRASDAAGLDYWTGQVKATLQAGQFVGSVLVNIMSGAQDTAAGQDITTLIGKVAVSLAYVGEQEEHGTVWAGASDIAAATALLGPVTSDPTSVLVGVREAETLIAAHA